MTTQERIKSVFSPPPAWSPRLSPITGLRTSASPPSVRPVADNAERVAAVHLGLRDAFPMLEIDQRNAAIVDALVEHGKVTITVGPNGTEIT